jgi:hypothetical protein
MSKQKTLQDKLTDQLQSTATKLGWAMMFGATVLSTVEVTTGREKTVLPANTASPFTDVRENTPLEGDNALRREKENEVGAHGAIYTVVARSQSRAGKQ